MDDSFDYRKMNSGDSIPSFANYANLRYLLFLVFYTRNEFGDHDTLRLFDFRFKSRLKKQFSIDFSKLIYKCQKLILKKCKLGRVCNRTFFKLPTIFKSWSSKKSKTRIFQSNSRHFRRKLKFHWFTANFSTTLASVNKYFIFRIWLKIFLKTRYFKFWFFWVEFSIAMEFLLKNGLQKKKIDLFVFRLKLAKIPSRGGKY